MKKLLGGFSKPQSVNVLTLDSVTYFYVSSLSLPAILVPAIAITRVHPPTWASPVSAQHLRLPHEVIRPPGHISSLFQHDDYPPRPTSPFRFWFLLCSHLPTNLPPPFIFPRV